jgi:hypothetical protein
MASNKKLALVCADLAGSCGINAAVGTVRFLPYQPTLTLKARSGAMRWGWQSSYP